MHYQVSYYLTAGAIEVWIVWESGNIDFYNQAGQIEQSNYINKISLPNF